MWTCIQVSVSSSIPQENTYTRSVLHLSRGRLYESVSIMYLRHHSDSCHRAIWQNTCPVILWRKPIAVHSASATTSGKAIWFDTWRRYTRSCCEWNQPSRWILFPITCSEQLSHLIEENRKQKEMILFLLDRNKQLQEGNSGYDIHL